MTQPSRTPHPSPPAYDPLPCYPPVDAPVTRGWAEACASLSDDVQVLAVDGPAIVDGSGQGWRELAGEVAEQFGADEIIDVRDHLASWDQIVKLTAPVDALRDDPDFATLPNADLVDLFNELPHPSRTRRCVVFGPGAAFVEHDALWYVDMPKRYAENAISEGHAVNLGQPADAGPGTTRRLFYIDWPLLDRHRDEIAADITRFVDLQDVAGPTSLDGDALRATAERLSHQPFRTRPTFNTTSWGGHWGQQQLGMNPDARNTALGYELIAPESGVLVGALGEHVEVPFQLVVALQPQAVLGLGVYEMFGTSFPVRFDYLDTVDGGSLSVHCHPQEDQMRKVFGWPYTQHETYYVMVGGSDGIVYLGLRGDADLEEFHRRAHYADAHAVPFDITDFVQTFDAQQHQLFLIPAGTPHGSGVGNVVLEVSATPYLYSLRFYDWLRRDADGAQRPVHVEHAFANLNRARRGDAVRDDLVQQPRTVAEGDGWTDEVIGALPEMFYEVRRLTIQPGASVALEPDDRFCVLNVVAGDGAVLRWDGGSTDLAYAETAVVPAATRACTVAALGGRPVRIVRAFVR